MAPRGGHLFVGVTLPTHSERRVGVEIRRRPLGHELTAPGALDLGAVGTPELIAYQFEALEDCEGLLGHGSVPHARAARR